MGVQAQRRIVSICNWRPRTASSLDADHWITRSLCSESPLESASRGGYKLSLAQPDFKTAGSRDEGERKKKGSACRIGYHELSRRTVASEGCQPVDLVRNPHRVEFKPGLAKRFHERFTQPDPDPNSISFPCRLRFSRRRRDCL